MTQVKFDFEYAVGLEFGQFFARLGTRVTLLQRSQTLLSGMVLMFVGFGAKEPMVACGVGFGLSFLEGKGSGGGIHASFQDNG